MKTHLLGPIALASIILVNTGLTGSLPFPYVSVAAPFGPTESTAVIQGDPTELLRRPVPSALTQRMNNERTGVNDQEYVLTPEAVTSGEFHRLRGFPVDGQIYGQPLFIPSVAWSDGTHRNLIIVTTTRNSVFVFDADGPSKGRGNAPLSTLSLGSAVAADYMPMSYTTGDHDLCAWNRPPTAVAPDPDSGHPYNLAPLIGIVSTPVIDATSMTLFVVAKSIDTAGTIAYKLHALAFAPALIERTNSPVTINAAVPSSRGAGATNGTLAFDPRFHLQRAALLLRQGRLFIGFASHQDTPPFHGWLFEYDVASLALVRATALNVESDGAGIWQAGSGPVAMPDGAVIVMTGNSGNRGCIGQGNIIDPPDQENSFIRFAPNNATITAFRHPDSAQLNRDDLDLGSSGPVLLPGTSLVAGAGKDSMLFVLDGTSMQLKSRLLVSSHHEKSWNVIVRAFGGGWPHVHGTPVAWRTSAQTIRLFFWPEHSPLTVISVDISDPTLPLLTIAERGARAPADSMPGGLLSLSINGSRASTALLWATIPSGDGQDALTHSNVPGTLRVFAAGEVTRELWSSDAPGAFLSDRLGTFAKNAPPLVADGRVYVATHSDTLAVYGLMNWATLITHSTNAPRSLNLGRPFTDLVSVQNTGDRGWKSGSDRLQVRFVTSAGAVATASEVPLSRDIPWNGILQFDVTVPTPTAMGVYQVRAQMLNGNGVPFGENMDLGTVQMLADPRVECLARCEKDQGVCRNGCQAARDMCYKNGGLAEQCVPEYQSCLTDCEVARKACIAACR